jgi:hypothetical protein
MTEKANKYETDYQINQLKEHVENIKNYIERFYHKRSFNICLISPNDTFFVIGSNPEKKYEVLIPKGTDPQVYRQNLVDAIKELGFGDDDISYSEQYNPTCNFYNITLRW